MIGYLIQQELRTLLPPQVATLLTMVVVDQDDPAFARPTKFVGPVYDKDAADTLAAKKGWEFRQDGTFLAPGGALTRATADPGDRADHLAARPGRRGDLRGRRRRAHHVPGFGAAGTLVGVEAVIDKDLSSELLAEDVSADLFLMATDVDGVYLHWGSPEQRRLGEVTPEELAGSVRGRVHGTEGAGGRPVHREDRPPRGDRLARRHRRDRGGAGRHQRGQAHGRLISLSRHGQRLTW